MHPQFQAWQGAPHSGVACVACHIGEGAAGFVHAKMGGVRQLIGRANNYPKPIPPGAKMPPGAQAETCKGCHSPDAVIGDRIRVIREYADDEANTETMTALQMHMSVTKSSARAIQARTDPAVRVEYVATDAERQTIPYVRVTARQKGEVKEYVAEGCEAGRGPGPRRATTMDCIDCHNTVGHPISPTPEQAVDRAIAAAMVSHRAAVCQARKLRLVKADYPSQEEAVSAHRRDCAASTQAPGGAVDRRRRGQDRGGVQDLSPERVSR